MQAFGIVAAVLGGLALLVLLMATIPMKPPKQPR